MIKKRQLLRMAQISTALSGVMVSAIAMAQSGGAPEQQGAAPPAPAAAEEIVVTGFRASLANAISQKRAADSIIDNISAEDIGSFPDTNIAESLQRVTGIQITRNRGEGQDVSIRGLEPKFARVLLNGDGVSSLSASGINTVGSSGQSRSFDFTILSSDFISALQVYKSPTADIDEGGMAGTIDVRTIRPLDLKSPRLNVNLDGMKNSYVDKYGYKATAIYADQFFDNTLGIMLGYDRSRRFIDTQSYQSSGMERKLESAYVPNGAVDFNFDGDTNDAYRLSHIVQLQNDIGTRDRESMIGTIQWKPTPELTLRGDALRSTFKSNIIGVFQSAQFHLPGDPSIRGNSIVADHISDIKPTSDDIATDNRTPIAGLIDYIDRNGVFLSNTNKFARERSRLFTYTGVADYVSDRWQISAQGTHSSSRKKSSNYGIDAQRWGNVYQDARTDLSSIPSFGYTRGTDPLDASKWFIPSASLVGTAIDTPVTSNQTFASADVRYEPGIAWLKAIKVGVKWGRSKLYQGDRRLNVTPAQFASITGDRVVANAFNGGAGINAAPYLTTFGGSDFLSRYKGDSIFPTTYLAPDTVAFFEKYPISQFTSLAGTITSALSSTYRIRETTQAAYIRADYAFFDDALTGNAGVRAVKTKQSSLGYTLDTSNLVLVNTTINPGNTSTPLTPSRTYTDWLPSLNGRFRIDDTKAVRFAVARTLTRPDLTRIVPSTSLSYVAGTVTSSNPDLNPYRAWNYDLSFEWYPTRNTLISAAFFYKKIQGYLVNTSDLVTYPIIIQGVSTPITFQRTRPVNGSNTDIKGLEIGFQQPFTMLPAPFDGLGVIANYTYTDAGNIQLVAGGPNYPLTSVSKNSYNLVLYFEKGPISTRVAYNYRSKYVEDILSSRNDGVYVKPIGQLDAQFSVKLSPNLSVAVEGTNLTDEPIERVNKYGFGRGFEVNGRTITFGVRMGL